MGSTRCGAPPPAIAGTTMMASIRGLVSYLGTGGLTGDVGEGLSLANGVAGGLISRSRRPGIGRRR